MKYTMIDGNRDGTFTLYGYDKDVEVYVKTFKTMEDAQKEAQKFLNGELVLA